MKREFLKGLGIEDQSIIDKILDEHHASTKTSANMQKENDTLKAENKALQEKLQKYDGVDVDTIKAEYQAKYDGMLKQNAISKALQGVKYPELLASKIDVAKLTIDGEDVKGLDEQLATLKTTYADFFNPQQQPTGFKPNNSQNNQPQSLTKEDIMKIADREEREKAIEDNLELFIS